jgi:TRAP-type uncharacterized transport system substrate-binding protein
LANSSIRWVVNSQRTTSLPRYWVSGTLNPAIRSLAMDEYMNRFFTGMLVSCLLCLSVNFAQAQDKVAATNMVISSGLQGGGYWKAAERLHTVASGLGLTVRNQASIGSLANMKELMAAGSPVSLAFVQADALQYYLKENPSAAQAIETLAPLGEECVFIISNSDSDIETDKDMQKSDRLHLGINSPNSGIWVTFDYMKSLIPEFQKTTLIYGDTVQLMTDMAHPKTNIDEALMIVHGPNERSPEIDMVIANPEQFRFVEISDERLAQTTATGEAVYRRVKVAPGAVENADPVETICMHALLLTNRNKLTAQQREKLTAVINTHWAQVRSTTE